MADVDISNIKQALRIDTDADDELLKALYLAASDYIKGAIGDEIEGFYDNNPRFNLAVLMLTDHYYKTRSATSEKTLQEVPFGVTSLILALKGEYYVLQDNRAAE